MSDDWPIAGTLLATRYRLVGLLETGGMAEIWRADDELLGRPVAVKLPTGPQVAWREARMAARLSHPGIAAVHDYREAVRPDGTVAPFVVMELLAGETVAARLVRDPIDLPEAARIGAAVADALAAAHTNGVVHRDVKPGNVMLTPNGVKILDFGISAAAGEPDDDDTGATFGTPAYVAPERLDGKPAEPATDVYGLGVLLFEMVTGDPPYPVDTWEELATARAAGRPALPTTFPDDFRALVSRCLDDDPDNRPGAGEVRYDLTALWLAASPTATAGTPKPAPSPAAEPAWPISPPGAEPTIFTGPQPTIPANFQHPATATAQPVPSSVQPTALGTVPAEPPIPQSGTSPAPPAPGRPSYESVTTSTQPPTQRTPQPGGFPAQPAPPAAGRPSYESVTTSTQPPTPVTSQTTHQTGTSPTRPATPEPADETGAFPAQRSAPHTRAAGDSPTQPAALEAGTFPPQSPAARTPRPTRHAEVSPTRPSTPAASDMRPAQSSAAQPSVAAQPSAAAQPGSPPARQPTSPAGPHLAQPSAPAGSRPAQPSARPGPQPAQPASPVGPPRTRPTSPAGPQRARPTSPAGPQRTRPYSAAGAEAAPRASFPFGGESTPHGGGSAAPLSPPTRGPAGRPGTRADRRSASGSRAPAGAAEPGARSFASGRAPAATIPMTPQPPRRRAFGLVVVALVVALAGIVTAINWPRPDTTAAPDSAPLPAPSTAVSVAPKPLEELTTTRPTSSPPPSRPQTPKPAATLTFAEAVTRMRTAVEDGAAEGEIRPDVATDLLNLLKPLTGSDGQDVDGQIDQLRRKIRERAGEASLSPSRAALLRSRLTDLDRAAGM